MTLNENAGYPSKLKQMPCHFSGRALSTLSSIRLCARWVPYTGATWAHNPSCLILEEKWEKQHRISEKPALKPWIWRKNGHNFFFFFPCLHFNLESSTGLQGKTNIKSKVRRFKTRCVKRRLLCSCKLKSGPIPFLILTPLSFWKWDTKG